MALQLNLPNTPQDIRLDKENIFTQFALVYEALRKIADNMGEVETAPEDDDSTTPAPSVGSTEYPLYIQGSAPSNPPEKYLWIQTGLGDDGSDFSVWFENGE